jgi:hypothetical protein
VTAWRLAIVKLSDDLFLDLSDFVHVFKCPEVAPPLSGHFLIWPTYVRTCQHVAKVIVYDFWRDTTPIVDRTYVNSRVEYAVKHSAWGTLALQK